MGNTLSAPGKSQAPPDSSPSACPVDRSAREAYVAAASQSKPSPPNASTDATTSQRPSQPSDHQRHPLDESRVTSSIPRALTSPSSSSSTTPAPTSPSSESHPSYPTPSSSGNWIYPSERMFFEAMARKSYNPHAPDMSTIVPIHNAVNERAWSEILAWERGSERLKALNQGCGGPRLRSFSGDAKKLSPRARWKTLIGYEGPFDRHDWAVERCGKGEAGDGVEYVIDFYQGRGGGKGGLSFYLDVRPKLNTWEGWRMRLGRWVGLG